MKRQTPRCVFIRCGLIGLLSLIAGCAGEAPPVHVTGPVTSISSWSYRDSAYARTIRTPHYAIHTTIPKMEFIAQLAELMEASLAQYQQFAPGVRLSSEPLECYVFQYRTEWAAFTTDQTGDDAALYLQINRGGYTVRDWYVAYYIGELGTYAVAAHEGWHQYVARHFKSRLPPFLEEGIATMFENVRFYRSPPTFDLSPRSHRVDKLRSAIENKNLWPLETLITMHAGDVVSLPGAKIEAFYAQNWAFAEFLWDAEDGRYRPALQKLLTDCANGTVHGSRGSTTSMSEGWNPESVQPMLEHYLGMDLDSIDRAYQAYCRKIAARTRFSS